jgi:hypothetical protein
VADVGVHARQGELHRFDAGIGAAVQQWLPGGRGSRRLAGVGGGEIQAGEDHVQMGHGPRIAEKTLRQPLGDLLHDAQVHVVEIGQPVTGRQRLGQLFYPGYGLID